MVLRFEHVQIQFSKATVGLRVCVLGKFKDMPAIVIGDASDLVVSDGDGVG